VRLAATWLVAGMVVALLASPWLSQLWSKSFHTAHFDLEVQSRVELNHVAVAMFEASPFVGWGLNNFQQQMGRYDRYGLIFADNPVHNVYLLYLAEAGLFGLAALLVLGVPLARSALRLSRSKDPLLSAVGYGVGAVYLFWAVEEILVFSLRQDHPRALLFVLSGLTVACGRLAGTEPATTGPGALLAGLIRMRGPRLRPLVLTGAAGAARVIRVGAYALAWTVAAARSAVRASIFGLIGPALAAARVASDRFVRALLAAAGRLVAPPSGRRRRLLASPPTRAVGLTVVLVLASTAVVMHAADVQAEDSPPDLNGASLVFQAVDRATGKRGLYTLSPGGGRPVPLPLADLGTPGYASWSPDGSQLAFSAHPPGVPDVEGAPEALYLVKPDGSGLRQLTANPWRNSQPKVSSDGRSVYFTSLWEEYPKVAVYRLDLATGLVSNISARTRPDGAFDSDPILLPDESGLLVADAYDPAIKGSSPGKVALLSLDGSSRRLLTDGSKGYDTDPAGSPDGRAVAISRYVGQGTPTDPNTDRLFHVKLYDFRLVLHDIASGSERELTKGHDCTRRPSDQPCDPADAPAWVPRFTPDGRHVGFVSVLSSTRVCICVVSRADGKPTALVESDELAIDWYDWVRPKAGAQPPLPTQVRPDRLLLGLGGPNGATTAHQAGADRWGSAPLPLDQGLRPLQPRWGADRQVIVFAGRPSAVGAPPVYGPAPPAGSLRQRHTLVDVGTGLPTIPTDDGEPIEPSQIFLTDLRTSQTRQLTTPGTEDWRDAIPDGEARSNSDPDISLDGRYVVFTSRSPHSAESFILRLDLRTGDVLSLTNATAGAMPVSDTSPRWSPSGSTVAFTSVNGEAAGIWVMNADGYGARAVVDDGYVNALPAWSPDGRSLAYASYRGTDPATALQLATAPWAPLAQNGWVLVRLDLATGQQAVLAAPAAGSVLSPVWSPDGRQVVFVSMSPNGRSDLYSVPATGGEALPVQLTLGSTELWVDWR
jgi:Tol biopolymer transport system component